jgi:hypothetical protein
MYLSRALAGFGDTDAGHTATARQFLDEFDKRLAALNARPAFCGDRVTFGALYVLNGLWGQIAAHMNSVVDPELRRRWDAIRPRLDEVNLRYSDTCVGKTPAAPSCPPCHTNITTGPMSTRTKVFIGAGILAALGVGFGLARS